MRRVLITASSIVSVLLLAACQGSSGPSQATKASTSGGTAASNGAGAGADAGDVRTSVAFHRLDAPPSSLLAQSGTWDLPTQSPPRARADRFVANADGSVLLRGRTALAIQLPGRPHGRLQVVLRGEPRGAPALAHLFALVAPIQDVEASDRFPDDMNRRIHATIATLAWPPGATEVATAEVEGDPATTWLMLSVETPDGGELRLEHVLIRELVPAATARRGVGAQTRPSIPLAAGATQRVELPALPAGATVEFGLAEPDGMAPLDRAIAVICRLPGSRERELTATFADGEQRPVVRRWRDFVFHVERASGPATLEVALEGPRESALYLSTPLVLPRRDAATPPSVLLVSIDTLRADRVGAWGTRGEIPAGEPASATPSLDAFARRCVRFARCYSPANFTIPAHASMMTGLEPAVHGAERFGDRRSIRAWPNLAGAFSRAGGTTAAFTGGGLVDAVFGFDERFDRYSMLDPLMTQRNPRYVASPRKEMPDYNRRLRDPVSLGDVTSWLEDHADRRFFLFLHTYHVHDYSPEESSLRRFGVDPAASWPKPADLDPKLFPTVKRGSAQLDDYSRTYDAALSETDAAFGRIVATLESSGALDHTVVLVTADHGEGFQEHGFLFHTTGLNDEVLHVPLLLFVPGVAPAVVDSPVSLIDVAPTLIELGGAEPLPEVQGRSLVPLLRGKELEERPLLAQDCPRDLTHSALISGRFKYIRQMRHADDSSEAAAVAVVAAEHLYDLVDDPREEHDLVADPAFAAALAQARDALDRKLAATQKAAERAKARRESVQTGADLDAELRALGYVGY